MPVIGSFHLRRRYLPSTSTSTLAGSTLLFLRAYRAMARAYWLPRKMSSSSFSRMDCCRQVGNIAVMPMPITAMTTSNTTIVKPRSSNGEEP